MKLAVYAVVLVVVTACLGQLNRLPVGSADSGLVIYANDLLIALAAFFYLGHALVVRKSWVIPRPMLIFGLFILIAPLGLLIGSAYLDSNQTLVSISYLVRYACYAFIGLIVADTIIYKTSLPQKIAQVTMWLKVLIIAGLLMVVSGFVQLFILPDFAELTKYGWDPHVGRLATAMLDPNYAGAYLSIVAFVCASLLLYSRRLSNQLILGAILCVVVAAIVLTFSRSAWVMLVAGLSVIAVFKARWMLLVGLVVAVASFIFIPRFADRVMGAFQLDVTASIRITSWQNSLAIASDNQPFGIGFNSYRYAQDRYGIVMLEDSGNAGAGADSSWLFILATTGIVGLVAYMVFYGTITMAAGRNLLNDGPPLFKATQLALVSTMVAMIPASMINNSLFYSWILQIWWVLIGLSLGILYHQSTTLGRQDHEAAS